MTGQKENGMDDKRVGIGADATTWLRVRSARHQGFLAGARWNRLTLWSEALRGGRWFTAAYSLNPTRSGIALDNLSAEHVFITTHPDYHATVPESAFDWPIYVEAMARVAEVGRLYAKALTSLAALTSPVADETESELRLAHGDR